MPVATAEAPSAIAPQRTGGAASIKKKQEKRSKSDIDAPDEEEKTGSNVKKAKKNASNGKSPKKSKSKKKPKQQEQEPIVIQLDSIYDGENNGHPFYNDLIQRSKILSLLKGSYEGFILGLKEDACFWEYADLHKIRGKEAEQDWAVGQQVQFQITSPRYGIDEDGIEMKIEDGGQIKKGFLWCKGTIDAVEDEEYTIRHNAWNASNPIATKTSTVQKANIRAPY